MRDAAGMSSESAAAPPNGSGAAALLAAGIGSFLIGIFSLAADKSPVVKSFFVFYKPAGPLSGVTTSAILAWLAAWAFFEWRWRRRDLSLPKINAIAFILLVLGLLLTFPPIADLL